MAFFDAISQSTGGLAGAVHPGAGADGAGVAAAVQKLAARHRLAGRPGGSAAGSWARSGCLPAIALLGRLGNPPRRPVQLHEPAVTWWERRVLAKRADAAVSFGIEHLHPVTRLHAALAKGGQTRRGGGANADPVTVVAAIEVEQQPFHLFYPFAASGTKSAARLLP